MPATGSSDKPEAPFRMIMTSDEPYLGVYHACEPSIYSDIYPSNPDPQIKEIADLMSEWYELFIEMRYINREDVAFPPHRDLAINVDEAAQYGLTKDVVDLLQMLPYYSTNPNWNFGTDQGEFLMWGGFMGDMRGDDADWEHSVIDPFYASPDNDDGTGWDDPNGPYIRPWFATLTDCGNHGSLMVLNTQTFEMWCVEQLGDTSDPVLSDQPGRILQPTNRNDMSQYPSRPAAEFLQDMISRFRNLEWIPGGLYDHEQAEYRKFRDLYISAGWPDHFSSELFDRLRLEQDDADFTLQQSFKPIDELSSVVRMIRWQQEVNWMISALQTKLYHSNFDSEWERIEMLERQKCYEGQLHTREEWTEQQARMLVELNQAKAEYDLYRTRTGRFADLCEQEYAALSEDQFLRRMKELDLLLKDRDFESREDRMLREAKINGKSIDDETWSAFALHLEHEGRATATDSWLELDQIKSIIYDDLDGHSVRSLLVEAIRQRKEINIWA